eukprot:s1204_g17.t1
MHHFQLIRGLGRGSGGEAILAEDLAGQKCVLKFVQLEGLPEDQCRRAMREVHFLRSLCHPNVLRIRSAFLHHFSLVLSVEFCDLGDLQALVSKRRELRDQEDLATRRLRCFEAPGFLEGTVKGMLVQMVSALDYIHSAGILHRDLKSSNIFLTQRGVVKAETLAWSLWSRPVAKFRQDLTAGVLKMAPRDCLRPEMQSWLHDD